MAAKLKFLDSAQNNAPCGDYKIPSTLKAQRMYLGNIKIPSRKGGSDGEAALARFANAFSTWIRENMVEEKPATGTNQAYINVRESFEGVCVELED